MTTTPTGTERASYEPNQAQLERAAAMRRFNWMTVYTPVTIVAVAVLVLIGLLLWGVFAPNIRGTQAFASALADIIIILTIFPLLLLCAIVPTAAVGYVIYRRRQPQAAHGRLQVLFWRLETLLGNVQARLEVLLSSLAEAVISGHGFVEYLRVLVEQVRKIIRWK